MSSLTNSPSSSTAQRQVQVLLSRALTFAATSSPSQKPDGEEVTYNPARFRAETGKASEQRDERREFATGELVQFTASDKALGEDRRLWDHREHRSQSRHQHPARHRQDG